jgi:hypothetical protein
MDLGERLSRTTYQRLAERWHRLAADATTPRTRDHLLKLAQQCEFLALGVGVAHNESEDPGLLGASQ